MKFIFRGHIVFEYVHDGLGTVIQHKLYGAIAAFDYCRMIPEDYKLLGEFFNRAHRHMEGEDVELTDIVVN